MRWLDVSGLVLLILVAAVPEVQALSFNFPPFFGSSERGNQRSPGPGAWQYRPQEPSNARGVPPSYQAPAAPSRATPSQMPGFQQQGFQQPGYQPDFRQPDYSQFGYQQPWPGTQRGWSGRYQAPYGQYAQPQTGNPPRLELELSDHQPYVQENALLKLRVVSDENLETATPELPSSNDVLLQKIEGPKATSRTGSQGRPEIVNEFVYTLTPLHAGDIEVPPLRVTGTSYASGYGYGQTGGRRFEATSPEPLHLQVRPAMASVRPWLPLQDLSMKATLDGGEEMEQGKPVTLTLELDAVGTTGSQLPNLEPLLRSPDYRVYREQTLNEAHLSSDGKRLEGKRTEYFTLVPSSGGKLQLPEIRLPWWNVTTGSKEYATLGIHSLQADSESGPIGPTPPAKTTTGVVLRWLWLPVVGVMLLLLGYWGGAWYKGRRLDASAESDSPARIGGPGPVRERLGRALSSAGATLSTGATDLAKRVNPTPLLARIKPLVSNSLPASTRFLGCVRAADREAGPAAWAERFQILTCRHLKFDAQTPLPGVTGKILALRPSADPEQLRRLMQQLDGALYGNQDIDFRRWKKQFRSQVGRRRGLAGASGRKLHLTRARLPELNPQAG